MNSISSGQRKAAQQAQETTIYAYKPVIEEFLIWHTRNIIKQSSSNSPNKELRISGIPKESTDTNAGWEIRRNDDDEPIATIRAHVSDSNLKIGTFVETDPPKLVTLPQSDLLGETGYNNLETAMGEELDETLAKRCFTLEELSQMEQVTRSPHP